MVRIRVARAFASALVLAGAASPLAGCGDTAEASGGSFGGSAGTPWFDAGAPDASQADSGSDASADAAVPLPARVRAEPVFTGPARVTTPATWNAHLPKLASDGAYVYAVHTHFPNAVDGRFAAILRRPVAPDAGSPTWTEVARIQYPHQPPGVVMDAQRQLHVVFDCLRPGASDVTCFQGGAGTAGNTSRFYHLVFSARDSSGALRFDTYANDNEWTAESNGYTGIGTTADGVTWWSLADSSWNRVVQSTSGAVGTLSAPNAYLLYPIHAAHPARGSQELFLYAGEFDPAGGNNASYLAATAYSGTASKLALLFREAPQTPAPGAVAAYPSDVAYDAKGTPYVLTYLPSGDQQCTELLRFDGGLALPPARFQIGCASDYAKLQISSRGILYVVAGGATGANMVLGVSTDRGATFAWHTIPIDGLPANGDVSYGGFTPVKPYTAPLAFAQDRIAFFFSGADATGASSNSYYGEVDLP